MPIISNFPSKSNTTMEIQNLIEPIEPVGTIKTTIRTDLGENWLLCNGDFVPQSKLYDIMPEYDITNPSHWKTQYLLGTSSSATAQMVYDNGVLYAASVKDKVVYIQEMTALSEGFSEPVALNIPNISSYGTAADIKQFKKLRNYYVFILYHYNSSQGYSMAYSTSIYGQYTLIRTVYANYQNIHVLGCTDSLFFLVADVGDDSKSKTLNLYYATSLAAFSSASRLSTIYISYASGSYSASIQNFSYANNNNYLVLGYDQRTASSSTSFSKSSYLQIIAFSTATCTYVYSRLNHYGSSPCVYLLNGVFYAATYVQTSSGSSTTRDTYLHKIINGSASAIIDGSSYSYISQGPYFIKDGKLYQFSTNAKTLYVADNIENMYKAVRSVYDLFSFSDVTISLNGNSCIVADTYTILYAASNPASRICTKYLPEISLADSTYSYIRSD